MTDWTSGYVADIGYTFGYYPELNPLRVKLAFLNAGLASPDMGTACELGFGQGMSANLHAAASVMQWELKGSGSIKSCQAPAPSPPGVQPTQNPIPHKGVGFFTNTFKGTRHAHDQD